MQRYFVEDANRNGSLVVIDNEDVHHIRHVMRMKEQDTIICCFHSGKAAICEITDIEEKCVVATIKQWEEQTRELPVDVTIFHGLPKVDKLEWVIQKGTELGMKALTPFTAKRSVVKWDTKKQSKKVERWNKIAKEAAEQSYRNRLPIIHAPISVKEMVQQFHSFDAVLVAYEEVAKQNNQVLLAERLEQIKPGSTIALIVGPEGGLTEEEVEEFLKHGAQTTSLGPRILRTETAPLYFLSTVSYQFEMRR